MKTIFIGALFLASALTQQVATHAKVSEQSYISSISAFKKGYRIPKHLKGKSLLNSPQWASLQTPPEVKVQHQEAALHTKPVNHQAQVESTTVTQELGGQLTIQKTHSDSNSHQTVQVPAVTTSKDQTHEQTHSHDWNQDSQSKQAKNNLRRQENHHQQQLISHEQPQKAILLVDPLPAPVPYVSEPIHESTDVLALSKPMVVSEHPMELIAHPGPVMYAPEPVEAPIEMVDFAAPISETEIEPIEPMLLDEPVALRKPMLLDEPAALRKPMLLDEPVALHEPIAVNSMASKADDILESEGHGQVFSEQYPSLSQVKMGTESV